VAPRALWKGFIAIAELTCPVALYAAASTSDRIAFRTLNRATGHPVKRSFIDRETSEPVPAEEQVKGYEVGQGDYVVLEPEEVASVVPHGEKTLAVENFIPCREVDDVYFDKPYYIAPSDAAAHTAFAVIRDAMSERKVAALARATLFRRVRTVLLRPHGDGIIGHTLNFDYEVRSAAEVFAPVPDLKLEPEMIELARHIIETKLGTFDPASFDDRYEEALADLVKAKMQGKPLPKPAPVVATPKNDLLAALRQSAGIGRRPADPRALPPGKADAKPAKERAGSKPASKSGKSTPAARASSRRKAS
jgi:DNA end-binding protein Ku